MSARCVCVCVCVFRVESESANAGQFDESQEREFVDVFPLCVRGLHHGCNHRKRRSVEEISSHCVSTSVRH